MDLILTTDLLLRVDTSMVPNGRVVLLSKSFTTPSLQACHTNDRTEKYNKTNSTLNSLHIFLTIILVEKWRVLVSDYLKCNKSSVLNFPVLLRVK